MTRSRTFGIIFLTGALFGVASLLVPQISAGQNSRDRGDRIPNQYIVVFKDSVKALDAAEAEIVARVHGERLHSYRSAVSGFAARFSDAELERVASDPRVAFVSEDREVAIIADSRGARRSEEVEVQRSRDPMSSPAPTPSPSPAPEPTPTPAPAPTPTPPAGTPSGEAKQSNPVQAFSDLLPTGAGRIGAGGSANKGTGVNVAVIDTGIQLNHPDLSGNIVGGKNCSTGTSYSDGNGHGTHVAGTIAAMDNGSGVVGVAPEAKLWAVRVLNNSGGGSWSTVICGIDFVTSKAPANGGPITVANLSLGGSGVADNSCGNSNNDALHKAICRARDAGITFIVAAGNSGSNAANFVPAAYNDAVVTVSALVDTDGAPGGAGSATSYGPDDTFASFSNWGSPVDIGAPGVSIYSTWIGSSYKSISGTSMASPHVAGAAALYIAAQPGALWGEVRDALISSGEPLGDGHSDPSGKHPEPVLRIDRLLSALSGDDGSSTPPPPPPSSPSTGLIESFEEGLNAWTQDSQNDWAISSARASDGTRAVEVDGNANDAAIVSHTIDLGGGTSAAVTFDWYIEGGLDSGEYIAFDVSRDGGATWEQMRILRGNIDLEDTWHSVSMTISTISSLQIRFRGAMSTSSEDAYVDNVRVTAL